MNTLELRKLVDEITQDKWWIEPNQLHCADYSMLKDADEGSGYVTESEDKANAELMSAAPQIARNYIALQDAVKNKAMEWKIDAAALKDMGYGANHLSGVRIDCRADELMALLEDKK